MDHVERFDLTRVRLRQYRSIQGCDVRLGPLNLLVGPNGAGKSNFLDALRFTAQSLTDNLDSALRERGGVTEVRRRSTGHPTHFGVELAFQDHNSSGVFRFQIAAVKGGDYRISHEEMTVTPHELGREASFYLVRDGTLVKSSAKTALPAVVSDRLFLVALSGLPEFRPAFDGLANMRVYNLGPDEMRRPQPADSGDVLRRDGSNIASVVERLRREQPKAKLRVEDYLSTIVSGVDGVERRAIDRWEQIEFRQRVSGATAPWKFPSTSMSDGTLRAVGVLVALFAPTDDVFGPIGIEEPESALHPAAAGLLLDALRDASRTRQILATTHSPDLLDSDSIKPHEVIGVRATDGTTHLGPLDAVGRRALDEDLYTAGELLRVDQLQPEPDTDQTRLF